MLAGALAATTRSTRKSKPPAYWVGKLSVSGTIAANLDKRDMVQAVNCVEREKKKGGYVGVEADRRRAHLRLASAAEQRHEDNVQGLDDAGLVAFLGTMHASSIALVQGTLLGLWTRAPKRRLDAIMAAAYASPLVEHFVAKCAPYTSTDEAQDFRVGDPKLLDLKPFFTDTFLLAKFKHYVFHIV